MLGSLRRGLSAPLRQVAQRTAVRNISSGNELFEKVKSKDGHEREFVQAVAEVLPTLEPVFQDNLAYLSVMENIVEPERVISFRVHWTDDAGNQHVNRGFRVQFNSAIGPYKGGLRFHPSVNQGILKFLGFEQIFKNALTTLPMGGGKGGSDFDPKGKSDREVYAFCRSFMTELQRHIGELTDVPAGDIGVGGREIGFMYGVHKTLKNTGGEQGFLTGKGLEYGGSLLRPEATGYGAVYFAKHMAEELLQTSLEGKICAVSGSGNVAQYCVERLLSYGAKPVSMSDSKGCLYVPDGINTDMLQQLMMHRNDLRLALSEFDAAAHGAQYIPNGKPWSVIPKIDCAFPSACENEINADEAKMLAEKGCILVSEGANMPSTNEAIEVYHKRQVLYGLGKAANAGGVAVSGLEMSQDAMHLMWTRDEVDVKLQWIMKSIFNDCVTHADLYGFDKNNLAAGANIAGFLKVAHAMMAHGQCKL